MFRNIKKALAIACVSVVVGAATVPSIVSAQNSAQNSTASQAEKRKPYRGDGWKKLNLTESQKTQLKTIRENAKTQRQNVLTAEQRAQIEQARQSGDRKGVRKNLNLTEAQKQQMKAIGASTKSQVDGVLTPEQKQQLEQMKQERKANRGR